MSSSNNHHNSSNQNNYHYSYSTGGAAAPPLSPHSYQQYGGGAYQQQQQPPQQHPYIYPTIQPPSPNQQSQYYSLYYPPPYVSYEQTREASLRQEEWNALILFLLGFLVGGILWIICYFMYRNSESLGARRYARWSGGLLLFGFILGITSSAAMLFYFIADNSMRKHDRSIQPPILVPLMSRMKLWF